jgi:hypothetical protein
VAWQLTRAAEWEAARAAVSETHETKAVEVALLAFQRHLQSAVQKQSHGESTAKLAEQVGVGGHPLGRWGVPNHCAGVSRRGGDTQAAPTQRCKRAHAPAELTTPPQMDTDCTALVSDQQLLGTRFAASTTHGQLSAAQGCATTVSRSHTIRLTS